MIRVPSMLVMITREKTKTPLLGGGRPAYKPSEDASGRTDDAYLSPARPVNKSQTSGNPCDPSKQVGITPPSSCMSRRYTLTRRPENTTDRSPTWFVENGFVKMPPLLDEPSFDGTFTTPLTQQRNWRIVCLRLQAQIQRTGHKARRKGWSSTGRQEASRPLLTIPSTALLSSFYNAYHRHCRMSSKALRRVWSSVPTSPQRPGRPSTHNITSVAPRDAHCATTLWAYPLDDIILVLSPARTRDARGRPGSRLRRFRHGGLS